MSLHKCTELLKHTQKKILRLKKKPPNVNYYRRCLMRVLTCKSKLKFPRPEQAWGTPASWGWVQRRTDPNLKQESLCQWHQIHVKCCIELIIRTHIHIDFSTCGCKADIIRHGDIDAVESGLIEEVTQQQVTLFGRFHHVAGRVDWLQALSIQNHTAHFFRKTKKKKLQWVTTYFVIFAVIIILTFPHR